MAKEYPAGEQLNPFLIPPSEAICPNLSRPASMLATSRLKLLRPLSRQTLTSLASRATPELQLATCLPTKLNPIRLSHSRQTARINIHTGTAFDRIPRYSSLPLLPSRRAFHQSPVRRDIFFVTVPAVKAVLLQLVRVTLIFLPFVSSVSLVCVLVNRAKSGWVVVLQAWRWRLFSRFPKATRGLWQLPLFSLCLVLALGLNQSPKTARWRLLLMTENEEFEWGKQR